MKIVPAAISNLVTVRSPSTFPMLNRLMMIPNVENVIITHAAIRERNQSPAAAIPMRNIKPAPVKFPLSAELTVIQSEMQNQAMLMKHSHPFCGR